jgi:hypothetical protein
MKIIVTDGTLFTPTRGTARYNETARIALDISQSATISELIELVDDERPPVHPGASYLSFSEPHGPLPTQATLGQLGIGEGSLLRRFSRVR